MEEYSISFAELPFYVTYGKIGEGKFSITRKISHVDTDLQLALIPEFTEWLADMNIAYYIDPLATPTPIDSNRLNLIFNPAFVEEEWLITYSMVVKNKGIASLIKLAWA